VRVSGSDCVATQVCDPNPASILRGGWDNTAGVSGSGGIGCAIFLDRVGRWKRGQKWKGRLGAPAHDGEAVTNGVRTHLESEMKVIDGLVNILLG